MGERYLQVHVGVVVALLEEVMGHMPLTEATVPLRLDQKGATVPTTLSDRPLQRGTLQQVLPAAATTGGVAPMILPPDLRLLARPGRPRGTV